MAIEVMHDSIGGRLDLTLVRQRLLHPAGNGSAFTREDADELCRVYRVWWTLCMQSRAQRRPVLGFVPSIGIDEVLRRHCMNTAAFNADCRYGFGALPGYVAPGTHQLSDAELQQLYDGLTVPGMRRLGIDLDAAPLFAGANDAAGSVLRFPA